MDRGINKLNNMNWLITYTLDNGLTILSKEVCATDYTQAYIDFSIENKNAIILKIERI